MTALHRFVAASPSLVDSFQPSTKAVYPSPFFSQCALPRGGPWRDFQTPGTVTFFLTAPFKPAVSLFGDFNGWDAAATPMHTDGSGLFWATVRLTGPTRYRFAVTLDGSGERVTVADPYRERFVGMPMALRPTSPVNPPTHGSTSIGPDPRCATW